MHVSKLICWELARSPDGRRLRNIVEPVQILKPGDHLVVIAPNDRRAVLTRPLHHLARPRIVTHNVPAAEDLVKSAFRIFQNGIQRPPVRVKVTQDQKFHKRIVQVCVRSNMVLLP